MVDRHIIITRSPLTLPEGSSLVLSFFLSVFLSFFHPPLPFSREKKRNATNERARVDDSKFGRTKGKRRREKRGKNGKKRQQQQKKEGSVERNGERRNCVERRKWQKKNVLDHKSKWQSPAGSSLPCAAVATFNYSSPTAHNVGRRVTESYRVVALFFFSLPSRSSPFLRVRSLSVSDLSHSFSPGSGHRSPAPRRIKAKEIQQTNKQTNKQTDKQTDGAACQYLVVVCVCVCVCVCLSAFDAAMIYVNACLGVRV